METSDLTPQTDASGFRFMFIFLSVGDGPGMVFVPVDDHAKLTDALLALSRSHATLLNSEQLRKVVVIEGHDSAQMYDVATFRWLCGIGPNKNDPNWMGDKL